jgi:hypothetical protein
MNAGGLNCAICESANCGESSWYLVIENRWQDRLKILNWNRTLALRAGMISTCGTGHLMQLVTRWITTGSLGGVNGLPPLNPELSALIRERL